MTHRMKINTPLTPILSKLLHKYQYIDPSTSVPNSGPSLRSRTTTRNSTMTGDDLSDIWTPSIPLPPHFTPSYPNFGTNPYLLFTG